MFSLIKKLRPRQAIKLFDLDYCCDMDLSRALRDAFSLWLTNVQKIFSKSFHAKRSYYIYQDKQILPRKKLRHRQANPESHALTHLHRTFIVATQSSRPKVGSTKAPQKQHDPELIVDATLTKGRLQIVSISVQILFLLSSNT